MISFYPDKLYPLQGQVLTAVNNNRDSLELYLTGGTCLSRGYFQHRYSVDLDFFHHDHEHGHEVIDIIVSELKNSFDLEETVNRVPTKMFRSILVEKILKVDFVCDVGKHWGNFVTHDLYPLLDNLDNILANKISAMMDRDEAKDMVDIWKIYKHQPINWPSIFTGVNTKAAGILPPLVAKRISEFPIEWIDKVDWIINPPTHDEFKQDIDQMIEKMLQV